MIPGPNWTRRYGSPSRRLCARPGCGAQAAATLRFQPTRREAWLVEIDDTAARTEGDLCTRHATDLVLPRGWVLHDQRVAPALDARREQPAVETCFGPTTRGGGRERRAVVPPIDIELDEPVAAAGRPVRGRRPRRNRRPESVPAPAIGPAAEGDDLAGLLDAQTPLLRRAFGNVQLDD